jgi:hypothetical protein
MSNFPGADFWIAPVDSSSTRWAFPVKLTSDAYASDGPSIAHEPKEREQLINFDAYSIRPGAYMVFSPEAGYKFEFSVDRSCSPNLDPIWKLIFDLNKKNAAGTFDQIVHVAFTAQAPEEQAGIQSMAANGVSDAASKVVVNQVYPAAKAIEGVQNPTDAQKNALHTAMSQAATSVDV